MTDPFKPKFHSPIQNNIGPNFGHGLNFVTVSHRKTRTMLMLSFIGFFWRFYVVVTTDQERTRTDDRHRTIRTTHGTRTHGTRQPRAQLTAPRRLPGPPTATARTQPTRTVGPYLHLRHATPTPTRITPGTTMALNNHHRGKFHFKRKRVFFDVCR